MKQNSLEKEARVSLLAVILAKASLALVAPAQGSRRGEG